MEKWKISQSRDIYSLIDESDASSENLKEKQRIRPYLATFLLIFLSSLRSHPSLQVP